MQKELIWNWKMKTFLKRPSLIDRNPLTTRPISWRSTLPTPSSRGTPRSSGWGRRSRSSSSPSTQTRTRRRQRYARLWSTYEVKIAFRIMSYCQKGLWIIKNIVHSRRFLCRHKAKSNSTFSSIFRAFSIHIIRMSQFRFFSKSRKRVENVINAINSSRK